jgi:ubiquinone/menaquinone biosynthesis C-methylase UbiE
MSGLNADDATIKGFGLEWSAFDQSKITNEELKSIFDGYFELIDLAKLPSDAVIMDVGCGSGRWAQFAAKYCKVIHLVDPSIDALAVARRNLSDYVNCEFHHASTENLPVADRSCDLVYSLGVLHHIPDTASGIKDCVKKLKPGAPFLVYLYYRFDNRPLWFRGLWWVSNLLRKVLSRLPFVMKRMMTDLIAVFVYFPLARISKLVQRIGGDPANLPLSIYRDHSLYTMRTDSLDRLGTRLEHRFTRKEIHTMLESAGLENISFRESEPFWCAVGYKSQVVQ